MIFIYKAWEKFCQELANKNIHSVTAREVLMGKPSGTYVVLKHDVETNVPKAYAMAKLEQQYKLHGTYYVQAYLLRSSQNIDLLKKMSDMGHEISYHYDVMDFCKGNLEEAIKEYQKNVALFEQNGFEIKTVCQHGNPVVERVGYTSNRDFFRSAKVQQLFPNMSDIMVDFKKKSGTDFLYFSDAGRKFNLIYDPLNNDVINSDDKNIPFDSLEEMLAYAEKSGLAYMISTHPHRWTKNGTSYILQNVFFKAIKRIAKLLLYIPLMKKVMSRYYYLAKKI